MNKNLLFRLLCSLVLVFAITKSNAQCFNCGTGVDGAYNATSNTTIAGGTYNFTSFTIQSGVTVSVTGSQALTIRSTGSITINGTLTAQGGNGADGVTYTTYGIGGVGVAGGANGGDGAFSSSSGPLPGLSGGGTGGTGNNGDGWSGGGGAGYATNGSSSGGVGGFGGVAYGNGQLNPLTAGSGGGGGSGGYDCGGGGGGAGGGVIILSACGSISVGAAGSINSNGGNGGSDGTGNCGGGGAGSGGTIWLSAPSINNAGLITAVGGVGGGSQVPGNPYYGTGANGSVGRVRIDVNTFSGNVSTPAAVAGLVLAVTPAATAISCTAQGVASTTVVNGVTPYSYLWSNGQTTSSISVGTAGSYSVTVTDDAGCSVSASVSVSSNVITLTGSVTTTDVSCYGGADGSAQANLTNGAQPYIYSWSPSGGTGSLAQNLGAAQYTVSVTDNNGCTGTFTGTVNQPELLVATPSATAVSCFGLSNGSIAVSVSGGVPGYSIDWAGGANGSPYTNLSAGTYSYTATDDNGCQATGSANVIEPALFSIGINATNVTCQGGSDGEATAVVTNGGTGTITYLWSTFETGAAINGLSEGQINVVGSDANQCTATATANISYNFTLPVVSLGNDVTQCGGQVNLDAQNAGSTFAWSDNSSAQTLTVTQSGTYGVTVTDANTCSASDEVDVTINALPVVALGNDVTQCGGQVDLDAQNAGSTFAWSDNSTAQTLTVTQSGTYDVTVTDANTCTASDEVDVTINALPAVDLGADTAQCAGQITLDAQNAGGTFAWSDNSTAQTLTVTQSGTYGVTVTDANTCTASDEVDVTINTAPALTFSLPNERCSGLVDSLIASPAGGVFSGTGVSGNYVTLLAAGTEQVVTYNYTDGNGCSATAVDTVTSVVCSGIAEATLFSVNIFPNPNNGSFTISGEAGINATLSVTNALGQNIAAFALTTDNSFQVNLNNLAAGTYFITYKSNKTTVSKKVLVQN